MKIKKIIKIKNVGKFKNFSCKNDNLSFSNDTLIFANNTYGKSTLVAIFRSMQEGKRSYVFGRKTFKAQAEPEIEILFDDNSTKNFHESNWSLSNIEIFDNTFIYRNIFYGDRIEKEQQANLYDILIDDEIGQMKKSIDKEKDFQSNLEAQKIKIKNEYTGSSIMPFDDFIKLEKRLNIDQKIFAKQMVIKQQKNSTKIKYLLENTFIKNDFFDFKNNFKKTIDLSIETVINEHVNNNWKNPNHTKDFLSIGVNLLKEKNKCVFCGQSLNEEAKELIANFKRVFSVEYKTLKNIIKEKGDKFLSLDIEKELLLFKDCGLDLDQEFNKEEFANSKKEIDEQIKNKQGDLNLRIDFSHDEDFNLFESELKKLKTFLKKYQNNVKKKNNLVSLNEELQILKIKKNRFTIENIAICKKFQDKLSEIEKIKNNLNKLNKDLDIKVLKVFKDNKKNINDNLESMDANFKLEEFVPKKHMGHKNTHFCDYRFVFNGTDKVPISNKLNQDTEEPEHLPHFKNTLSDSDKSLLAFAFFLSKLKNDENLGSKIIILDDPFSSLDENRKESTVRLLKNIENFQGKKPLQKIILTHEIGFLCKYYKMCKNDKNSHRPHVLKIFNSLEVGSILDICDIENEFLKESFFQDLEYIQNTIKNSTNIDESLQKVRSCLEHLLKRKYYFSLDKSDLSCGSVTRYLEKIDRKCPVKNEILDANFNEKMHDNHPVMKLNEPAKIKKLKDFLDLIKKI